VIVLRRLDVPMTLATMKPPVYLSVDPGGSEVLGMSRSVVSRRVQELETQLDSRLFTHHARHHPDRGRHPALRNCRPMVDKIVQAVQVMRELRRSAGWGLGRNAATVGFGRKLVAPPMRRLHATHPDSALDLALDDQPTEFVAEAIYMATRNGCLHDRQGVVKRLVSMPILVCASPKHARHARAFPLRAYSGVEAGFT
jgi:LysR family transcriptional regulator for bpeEF and oprC